MDGLTQVEVQIYQTVVPDRRMIILASAFFPDLHCYSSHLPYSFHWMILNVKNGRRLYCCCCGNHLIWNCGNHHPHFPMEFSLDALEIYRGMEMGLYHDHLYCLNDDWVVHTHYLFVVCCCCFLLVFLNLVVLAFVVVAVVELAS